MKKITLSLILMAFLLIANSCSNTMGSVNHQITTTVTLSEANYKVIASVTGKATASNLFGISMNNSNLVDQARRDMINKANLIGGSKAIINVTTDVRLQWFFIGATKTVYVSGEVIEFTK